MKPEQALQTLINAVNHAQTKGVYTLNDAKVIAEAIDVFVKKGQEIKETTKEEEKVEEVTETKDEQSNG